MTAKEKYLKRVEEFDTKHNELWTDLVIATNKYLDAVDEVEAAATSNEKPLERVIDNLCLAGAWVHDRLNGKAGYRGGDKYGSSRAKRIRKILGYTL